MSATEGERAAAVRQMILDLLPQGCGPDARIFGVGGALDSLALVNFLADLEHRVGEKFGRDVVLASDRAMSRSRSPFRDVASLTDYLLELLAE